MPDWHRFAYAASSARTAFGVRFASASLKCVTKGADLHALKPIASDHVVLWPRQIECIDEERSEPRYRASFVTDESPPDDTNFSDVRRLVIDPAKVPKELTVFRAAHYTAPLLVRAEAAARIAAQGFEGFAFKPPRR